MTDLSNCMIIRGKLENELAQMTKEDAAELLEEFSISAPATEKKKGTLRLEGKTYTVCDGDIISFRFNV